MTDALDIAPAAPYADADAGWADDADELPPRRRNRLVSPLNLLLMAILVAGGGFVGGVLVEKHDVKGSSTGGAAGGLAARFAAAAAGAGTGTGAASSTGASSTSTGTAGAAGAAGAGGFAALRSEFGGAGGGAAGAATTGTVSTVQGHTLYVTDSEGNTIEVKVQSGAKVSKTISTAVAAIHPGDTVIVTGTTGSNGTVAATAVRATAPGVSAGGGAGFAGLFGGAGASTTGRGGGAATSGSGGSSGAPSLFGG